MISTAAAIPALLQPPEGAVLEEERERRMMSGTQPAWDCSLLPPGSLFSSKGSRALLSSLSPVRHLSCADETYQGETHVCGRFGRPTAKALNCSFLIFLPSRALCFPGSWSCLPGLCAGAGAALTSARLCSGWGCRGAGSGGAVSCCTLRFWGAQPRSAGCVPAAPSPAILSNARQGILAPKIPL